MKVLVVDDNRCLVDSIAGILEDEGIEVMSAGNGQEGYDAYLRFKPDLVITDIQMPGENGLEMMAHIRTHDPMVKTVYMSGNINAYRASLEGEKKRYPVTVFEKPFPLELLTMLVSEPATCRLGENAFAAQPAPM
jgi:DNA-binding NtrC family response regulator